MVTIIFKIDWPYLLWSNCRFWTLLLIKISCFAWNWDQAKSSRYWLDCVLIWHYHLWLICKISNLGVFSESGKAWLKSRRRKFFTLLRNFYLWEYIESLLFLFHCVTVRKLLNLLHSLKGEEIKLFLLELYHNGWLLAVWVALNQHFPVILGSSYHRARGALGLESESLTSCCEAFLYQLCKCFIEYRVFYTCGVSLC